MAQDDGQAAAPEEAAQPQRVDTTPRYRIGAVSRLTGISTHTLRVWERRYGALSPQRTEGGDRLYSDADLVKLRLLKELQAMGHSIGTIAHLPLSGLTEIATSHRRLGATTTGGGRPAEVVNAFMEALANFALDDADRLLSQAVGQLGPRELVHSVFAPILQQVGEHWESGALGIDQEHAASTLLRNQLAVVMRTYMALGPRPQRAVLTTPSGELHEFGALLAAILFSMHGWQATYLGPNLPAAEIARTVRQLDAQVAALSWVSADPARVMPELALLRGAVPAAVRIVLGGRAAAELATPPTGIVVTPHLEALESFLRETSATP